MSQHRTDHELTIGSGRGPTFNGTGVFCTVHHRFESAEYKGDSAGKRAVKEMKRRPFHEWSEYASGHPKETVVDMEARRKHE